MATRICLHLHWVHHAAFQHRRYQNWVCFFLSMCHSFFLGIVFCRLSILHPQRLLRKSTEFQHHSRQGRSESECRSDWDGAVSDRLLRDKGWRSGLTSNWPTETDTERLTTEPRRSNTTDTYWSLFWCKGFGTDYKKLGSDGKRCLISAIAYRLWGVLLFGLVTRPPLHSFLFFFSFYYYWLWGGCPGLSSLTGRPAATGFLAIFPCTISGLYWCTRPQLLGEDRGRGERWKRDDALAVLRALGLDSGLIEDTPYFASPPFEYLDCIVFY